MSWTPARGPGRDLIRPRKCTSTVLCPVHHSANCLQRQELSSWRTSPCQGVGTWISSISGFEKSWSAPPSSTLDPGSRRCSARPAPGLALHQGGEEDEEKGTAAVLPSGRGGAARSDPRGGRPGGGGGPPVRKSDLVKLKVGPFSSRDPFLNPAPASDGWATMKTLPRVLRGLLGTWSQDRQAVYGCCVQ